MKNSSAKEIDELSGGEDDDDGSLIIRSTDAKREGKRNANDVIRSTGIVRLIGLLS